MTQWAEITSIEPSHAAAGTAYLTASRYMWDDYRPYVFKTTDYGKHWSALTNGLPDDQSVFIVREDPDDAALLFLGNANSVYASFDGGAQWQPLAMGLPHAQVRDIAINTREGEVVAATHGRSFWILDNLSLLEQWSRNPNPAADAARLYAPQTAWLTHAYGKSERAKYREPVGVNPPFGATVFFHIPANYDGKTPASLEILDDQGHAVRHYALHLKKKQKKLPKTVEDNLLPSQEKRNADEKLTAISPGMNSLQWNLRYDDATDVIGFEPPEETDDLTADASRPAGQSRPLHGGTPLRRRLVPAALPGLSRSPAVHHGGGTEAAPVPCSSSCIRRSTRWTGASTARSRRASTWRSRSPLTRSMPPRRLRPSMRFMRQSMPSCS